MSMATEINIIGTGARVTIAVISYENSASNDISDANWLKCHVTVHSAACNVSFPATFMTYDFEKFADELSSAYNLLRGTASISSDMDALILQIIMQGKGLARVTGTVQLNNQINLEVKLGFDSDQSYLGQCREEILLVQRLFPVVRT